MADASGTLLLDVAGRRWSDEVLDALDIPRELAPAGARVAGSLRRRRAGVPWRPVPATVRRRAWCRRRRRARSRSCSGPPASCSPPCPRIAPDEQARVHASATPCRARWHAMGVMLSAAGSLQWLHDTIAPGVAFDALIGRGERVAAGGEGLLFLPYLQGERTPHADPDARGAFAGLQLRHDRGRARARRARGRRVRAPRLARPPARPRGRRRPARGRRAAARAPSSGCGSVASVLGVPIERTVVEEGSAFGAALLGGVARRCLRRRARGVAAAVYGCKDIVEPDPEWAARVRRAAARYRALYPALRDVDGSTVEAVKAVLIERPHEVAYVDLDRPVRRCRRGRGPQSRRPASAAPTWRCSTAG